MEYRGTVTYINNVIRMSAVRTACRYKYADLIKKRQKCDYWMQVNAIRICKQGCNKAKKTFRDKLLCHVVFSGIQRLHNVAC